MTTKSLELEQILASLVSFYPVTSDQDNVLRLLEYINESLLEAGLESQILSNNNVFMLYASAQGNKKTKILLQSHIDVVPAELKQRKLVKKGPKLYGRGVRDMLFAAASYIKFVHDNKDIINTLDLGIMLTGDEETGGLNTVPYLLKQGYVADIVWLPDAGNKLSELVMCAKGVYNFDIIVHGVAHHGSRPWEGDSATGKLIELLAEFMPAFDQPTNDTTTCTITQLEAGDSINKGPSQARAHIDIRFVSKYDLQKFENLVEDLCQKYQAKVTNKVVEPNYNVDLDSGLVKRYLTINKSITGRSPKAVAVSGSSDARYFSEIGMPVIMTRPTSGGSHSDDEWINLESFEQYYEVMRQYVLEIATIGE